jgi:glycosyltransferase involved in cell wall biosynthesis
VVSIVSFAPYGQQHQERIEAAGGSIPMVLPNFHVKRGWLTLRAIIQLRRYLRRGGIDLLHMHFMGHGAWMGSLSGFRPRIITVMGGDMDPHGWHPTSRRDAILTPWALRTADAVTAWSGGLAEVAGEAAGRLRRVITMHGGIDSSIFNAAANRDEEPFPEAIPADARVVASLRQMRRWSNLHTLAQASHEVVRYVPSAWFVYCFDDAVREADYESEVRALITTGPAATRSTIVGQASQDELARLLRRADLSVSLRSAHDGTPMSILESLACGAPAVVGRGIPFDHDVIEDGQTIALCDREDPSDVARTITGLLEDEPRRDALSQESIRRVTERGTREIQVAKQFALYDAVLGGKGEASAV